MWPLEQQGELCLRGILLMFDGWNADETATCLLAWQLTTTANLQAVATSGARTVPEDLWCSNPAATRPSAPSSGSSTQTWRADCPATSSTRVWPPPCLNSCPIYGNVSLSCGPHSAPTNTHKTGETSNFGWEMSLFFSVSGPQKCALAVPSAEGMCYPHWEHCTCKHRRCETCNHTSVTREEEFFRFQRQCSSSSLNFVVFLAWSHTYFLLWTCNCFAVSLAVQWVLCFLNLLSRLVAGWTLLKQVNLYEDPSESHCLGICFTCYKRTGAMAWSSCPSEPYLTAHVDLLLFF